jgi:hypothetical protein
LEEKFKKVQTQSLLQCKEPKLVDKPDLQTGENSLTVRIPTEGVHSIGLTSPILAQGGSHGLAFQHVLGVDMFNKEQLNELFNIAQVFRIDVTKQRSLDHVLRVSTVLSLSLRDIYFCLSYLRGILN